MGCVFYYEWLILEKYKRALIMSGRTLNQGM